MGSATVPVQLFFASTSPFARKARIVAHELGLTDRIATPGQGADTDPRRRRAALRVGPLEKTLLVHGERSYGLGGRPTSPEPFTTQPIRYEYAFGGADTSDPDPTKQRIDLRNPVGRGLVRRADDFAHAIEYPNGDPTGRGPAGFGPIDASWSPRRELAGTFDARWRATRYPLLPEDHDPEFALSAPADQRLDRPLVGGERVELVHMTPEGTWRIEVPRISLQFTTRFGPRREHHPALLTSLILEPEERRFSLVWQTFLKVSAVDADYLDVTEIREQRGAA